MSLYAEWRNLCDNHANNDEEIKFWENYLKSEAGIYNEILNNKTDVVEGTVAELAAKYGVSNELFMGFLDGISESVKEELDLEAIEAEKCTKTSPSPSTDMNPNPFSLLNHFTTPVFINKSS